MLVPTGAKHTQTNIGLCTVCILVKPTTDLAARGPVEALLNTAINLTSCGNQLTKVKWPELVFGKRRPPAERRVPLRVHACLYVVAPNTENEFPVK